MIAQPKLPLMASVLPPKLDPASGLIHASNVIFPDCKAAPHSLLAYTDLTVAALCPSKTNASSRSPRSTRRSRGSVSFFAGVGVGADADADSGWTRVGVVFSNTGAAGAGADSRPLQKSTKSSACSSIQSSADSTAAPTAAAAPPCNFRRLLELALSNSCTLSPGAARRLCDSTRFLMASKLSPWSCFLALTSSWPCASSCLSTSSSIRRAFVVATSLLALTTFLAHAFHSGTVPTQGSELFSAMKMFPTTRPM